MKVSSKYIEGKRQLTLVVKGDLLSTNAEQRYAELSELLKQHADKREHVRIDLGTAKMIDSVGLNLLLGLVRQVRESGETVSLRITSASVNRVLTFSHFNRIAEIDFREKEAE